MSKEAALIIGAIVAVLNAVLTIAGTGSFDDGLQWEDLVPILAPLLGALGIREAVWSQSSVDKIASREVQATLRQPRTDTHRG